MEDVEGGILIATMNMDSHVGVSEASMHGNC